MTAVAETDLQRLALDQITVDPEHNHRVVTAEDDDVKALAVSVGKVGVLVPLIVSPDGTLIAGHRRYLAAQIAGLPDVPVVVRDGKTSALDAAVENIARKDLTPAEEADALQAALDEGLTEQGAAEVLGWSPRLVTERKKLLTLPADARAMIGVALRIEVVDLLVELHTQAPKLFALLVKSVDPKNGPVGITPLRDWIRTTCSREPVKVGAWSTHASLRQEHLPKMSKALTDRWRALGGEHEYQAFKASFTEANVDHARASDCYVELSESSGLVTSDELVKLFMEEAIERGEADAKAEAEERARERAAKPTGARSPERERELQEGRDRRSLMPSVASVNEDIAVSMMQNLASVELTKDVALFFARGLLGPWFEKGGHLASENRAGLVAQAVALAVPELREVKETITTKGMPGPPKTEYADKETAAAWLQKFVEGGRTPQEILGRTLTVFAIARTVDVGSVAVGEGQKRSWSGLGSAEAMKALDKLAKPHIPGSVKGLERERAKLAKARDEAFDLATADAK